MFLINLRDLKRQYRVGLFAPLVALICIGLAIILAPAWTWTNNALSDLGHYTRTDIGPNPFLRAIIFNSGLIVTGVLMIYATPSMFREEKTPMGKLAMIILIVSECFLVAIGAFSENFGYIHYVVSVGFFFTFPFSMWFASISWTMKKGTRWLGIVSLFLPFVSLLMWVPYITKTLPWNDVAIPEITTALSCIIWVWLIIYNKLRTAGE